MADTKPTLVEKFKDEGKARLKELKDAIDPLIKERDELESLLNPQAAAAPAPASPRTPSGASASGTAVAEGRKRRRKRQGGSRLDQFVELVTKEPGITVARAAEVMQVQPNYLYRVAKDATEENKVIKDNKGYKAVSAA